MTFILNVEIQTSNLNTILKIAKIVLVPIIITIDPLYNIHVVSFCKTIF